VEFQIRYEFRLSKKDRQCNGKSFMDIHLLQGGYTTTRKKQTSPLFYVDEKFLARQICVAGSSYSKTALFTRTSNRFSAAFSF
jgi:hypothetical protein